MASAQERGISERRKEVFLPYPISARIPYLRVFDWREEDLELGYPPVLNSRRRIVMGSVESPIRAETIQIVTGEVRKLDPQTGQFTGKVIRTNGPTFRFKGEDVMIDGRGLWGRLDDREFLDPASGGYEFRVLMLQQRKDWVIGLIAASLAKLPVELVNKQLMSRGHSLFLLIGGRSFFWLPKLQVYSGGHQGMWMAGEMSAWRGAEEQIERFASYVTAKKPIVAMF